MGLWDKTIFQINGLVLLLVIIIKKWVELEKNVENSLKSAIQENARLNLEKEISMGYRS